MKGCIIMSSCLTDKENLRSNLAFLDPASGHKTTRLSCPMPKQKGQPFF
jgi:hypothetical protein